MKRIFDLSVSLIILVFFLPFFILIYSIVRYDSDGGGFFLQTRVGQYGKPFKILKFRTMTVNKSSENGSFDVGNSARITRAGRVLRMYKLDELPQFVNVLLGEMSLVGPRPEVSHWVEEYPQQWAKIHSVKPGITDPASIKFRDEEIVLARYKDPVSAYRNIILPEKLKIYEEYVENQSFYNDVKIIFQTFIKVINF